jgi:outer membrane protein assembly factor BamE (lipoprotein component of BamABCDE complex)
MIVAMQSTSSARLVEGARVRAASRVAALVLLSATLGGCLGYDGDVQHGYQMDPQSLADVKQGQTAEQVLVTLGTPSTTSTVGGDAWYYISQKTDRSIAFMKPTLVDQHIYAVYFDKGKKVTRVANYGMQDGKVVNFASGATPTAGADNSFLSGLFLNVNPLAGMMSKS